MNAKAKTTFIVGALCIIPLIVLGRIMWIKVYENRQEAIVKDLRSNVWPAEKKVTEERVKARQSTDETRGASTLNLKPYINAKLTEAPICWKGNNSNNLGELPLGTNIFAGVPFKVDGSIQLMGEWLKRYKKTYPSKVESIPVNRQCAKIHLLHGNAKVDTKESGRIVAKLIVHYEDKTTKEIAMKIGQQVFDWWFMTYTTGVPVEMRTPAPDTELAWVGSNPYLRQWAPDNNLCLYRTSFQNPKPGVGIATLDYVSTLTDTCPFLLGITIE